MNASDLSIFIFGIYVALAGIVFIIKPNVILALLKITPIKDPWIRVMGVILVDLAIIMLFMAINGVTLFYWATVYSRSWVVVGFTALVISKKAPVQFLGFGLLDAGGALWTLLTLV